MNELEQLDEIFELLSQISSDPTVSKNVKVITEKVSCVLKEEGASFELRRDKAIQLLGYTDSPNLCSFIRSMIYEVIAKLES